MNGAAQPSEHCSKRSERFADATAFIPVRRTVDTEAEVDGELHWLFRVLAGE